MKTSRLKWSLATGVAILLAVAIFGNVRKAQTPATPASTGFATANEMPPVEPPPAVAAPTVARPTTSAQKPEAEAARALRWTTGLRDESCACTTFQCASEAQHRYAREMGDVDFGRLDPALFQKLSREAGRCVHALYAAEHRGG